MLVGVQLLLFLLIRLQIEPGYGGHGARVEKSGILARKQGVDGAGSQGSGALAPGAGDFHGFSIPADDSPTITTANIIRPCLAAGTARIAG